MICWTKKQVTSTTPSDGHRKTRFCFSPHVWNIYHTRPRSFLQAVRSNGWVGRRIYLGFLNHAFPSQAKPWGTQSFSSAPLQSSLVAVSGPASSWVKWPISFLGSGDRSLSSYSFSWSLLLRPPGFSGCFHPQPDKGSKRNLRIEASSLRRGWIRCFPFCSAQVEPLRPSKFRSLTCTCFDGFLPILKNLIKLFKMCAGHILN